MRSLSYLKQISINSGWYYNPYWPNLAVESEQGYIIQCNNVYDRVKISIPQSVNAVRKVLFSNKRFHWKRKRRVGL